MQLSFVFLGDHAPSDRMRPNPWKDLDDDVRAEIVDALSKLMVKTVQGEEIDHEQ